MERWQFDLFMEKLEKIRCGIVDVETAAQNIVVGLTSASTNTAITKCLCESCCIDICKTTVFPGTILTNCPKYVQRSGTSQ